MPVYEYRCARGHVFEALQRMTDDPLTECEECGAPVQRVFHPVAVHFKGPGFYTTDYAKKAASADGDGDGKVDKKDGSDSKASDKGGDSKPAKETAASSD